MCKTFCHFVLFQLFYFYHHQWILKTVSFYWRNDWQDLKFQSLVRQVSDAFNHILCCLILRKCTNNIDHMSYWQHFWFISFLIYVNSRSLLHFHAYVHVGGSSDLKNEELERTVAGLQSKLKDVTAELEAEQEKVDIWIWFLNPFRLSRLWRWR